MKIQTRTKISVNFFGLSIYHIFCSVSVSAVRNISISSLKVFYLTEIKNTGFVRNKPNTNAEELRGL